MIETTFLAILKLHPSTVVWGTDSVSLARVTTTGDPHRGVEPGVWRDYRGWGIMWSARYWMDVRDD